MLPVFYGCPVGRRQHPIAHNRCLAAFVVIYGDDVVPCVQRKRVALQKAAQIGFGRVDGAALGINNSILQAAPAGIEGTGKIENHLIEVVDERGGPLAVDIQPAVLLRLFGRGCSVLRAEIDGEGILPGCAGHCVEQAVFVA